MNKNKVEESLQVLILKAGVSGPGGHVYSLEALREMAEKDPNFRIIRDELWWVETDPVKVKIVKVEQLVSNSIEVVPIHQFDTYPTCIKCGEVHLFKKPIIKYIPENDILQKTCIVCGYSWYETIHPINNRKGK